MSKSAIIVVSFGSSVPHARACLNKVEQEISRHYPDRDLFSSYTSGMIRKKLNAQGEQLYSPEELLKKLAGEGYTDVKIVSTHIIPGLEYEKLCAMAEGLSDTFEKITISKPLIHDAESIQVVAEKLLNTYPADEKKSLILMGHGTEHLSNFIYPALQTAFRTAGRQNAFVATVEGWPTLENVMDQLKALGTAEVLLAPFLLVAGDHVMNDMMGPEEDSWKNILEAEGFKVECCGKGLSEYPQIVALYCAE